MAASSDIKELRIALVCYGGVSLAIYMHGITKELYKLVRASRAFDAAYDQGDGDPGAIVNPFPAAGPGQRPGGNLAGGPEFDTEHSYFEALKALNSAGKPLTPAIDLISGTSAGGINGVCLARAIAGSRSVNGFRSLWLSDGDLDRLLVGHLLTHHLGLTRKQRMVAKLAAAMASVASHPDKPGAPLNGALMSQLLYSALKDMRVVPLNGAGPTLVRPGESLTLFVTTTDMHGYTVAIPTGTGGISDTDRSYRQLLSFSYEDGKENWLDDDSVPALAFAGRATSSFPGAFPPVSLATFADAVLPPEADKPATIASIAARFDNAEQGGAAPGDSWFIDGGVLDNGPFDHVVDAIAARASATEVARQIVYIEPDPWQPPGHVTGPETQPGWFNTVWATMMTIPRHQPLVATLDELRCLNDQIAEVGRITAQQMGAVLPLLASTGTAVSDPYDDVIRKSGGVRERAARAAGEGYPTYCRLRAEAVAQSVAGAVQDRFGYPPQSLQAWFSTAVLTAWARNRKEWLSGDPVRLESALGAVDLPFRERRLHFLLNGINGLYADPQVPRRDLGVLKAACWTSLQAIQSMAGAALTQASADLGILDPDQLSDAVALTDPEEYASTRGGELMTLFTAYSTHLGPVARASSKDLWDCLRTTTQRWPDHQARDALTSRYLAFPIWDALIYPTIALARLPQLAPIGVTRFSPLDAQRLQPEPDANGAMGRKLKGTALGHFGGFVEPSWRENDYLWGRLDAAELILGLLQREAGQPRLLDPQLKEALTAILATEEPALTTMTETIGYLRAQVENLPGSG
jgi:patatin-related protein